MTTEQAINLAKIHPELEDAVLENMPENLNQIEKTLFVYTKLCSILNYDPEYWASNQGEGPKQAVHINPHHVEEVSPENPDVVCYDFNVIFCKFLDKFGIKYEIKSFQQQNPEYGKHSDLYVIFDDPILKNFGKETENVIFQGYSDMKRFKVNHNIMTTANLHSSKAFRDFFEEIRDKTVEQVWQEQEKKLAERKKFEEDEQKIKALEQEFEAICPSSATLEEQEALDIFFKQLKNLDLNRYDASFYLQKCFKNLNLDNDEKIYTYAIMKEQNPQNPELFNMISILNICSDEEDFFVKITPPNKHEEISHKNLQKAFDEGKIDYIDTELPETVVLPHILSETINKKFAGMIEMVETSKADTIAKIKEQNQKFNPSIFPDERLQTYATYKHTKEKAQKNSQKEKQKTHTAETKFKL